MEKQAMSWPALLLCPLIALGNLMITYALVTPSCATQQKVWLHGLTMGSIIVSLLFTVMAWRALRQLLLTQPSADDASVGLVTRQRFIAQLSLWCGFFFTLTIIAQWIAQWMLSPCA